MDPFKSCLRAEVFDYVFSNGVLHHTANAFGGFQDLCRVLRPGGFIVIGLYNTYGRLLLGLRSA
jgi:SAM-dependent methyltransferase